MASKIPLSVKDSSCKGASGKCESNPGTLVSCSTQHQLLGPCSTRVSVTDWGAEVSLGTARPNVAREACNPGGCRK